MLPRGLWVEGYLAMGILFLLDATFTSPKTIPDEFEAKTLVNKIHEARTDRFLKGYEPDIAR